MFPDDEEDYYCSLYRGVSINDDEENEEPKISTSFSVTQEWVELFLSAGYHIVFRVGGALEASSEIKVGCLKWSESEIRAMVTDFLVQYSSSLHSRGVDILAVCQEFNIPEYTAKSLVP